jgi:ComF family protein
MVNKWLNIIRSYLYPASCAVCGFDSDTSLDICSQCRDTLPYNTLACTRCALPLEFESESAVCGQCLSSAPEFNQAFSLLHYARPTDHLIQAMKFNGKLRFANLLGGLLADALSARKTTPLPQVILPVPLHTTRQRDRGFNQALEIARPVSKALKIPLKFNSCIRTRPTLAQSTLNAKKRRANIRGAFKMTENLNVQHVAIIDDVITTGQTVNEMARTLKQQGIENIEVWSIARAE